jgi:hypothetical protein
MPHEPVVEFCDEGGGRLVRLSYAPMDEDVGTLLVEMRAAPDGPLADRLVCDAGVESAGGDGLDAFLAELVRDWEGWSGTCHWKTVFGELRIEATHRGRLVELLFVLAVPYRAGEPGLPDVELRFRIDVLPGESLSALALAAARLIAPPRGRECK